MQSFHRARQVLADELGIDPMPETADLYQAILGQAPADSLLPPAARPSVTIPSPRATAPERPAETPIEAGDARGSVSVLLRQEIDDVPRRRHDDLVPAEAQPSGRNAVPSLVESLRTASPDLLAVATVSAFVPQPCVPEGVARLTGLAPLHVAVVQERLCDLGILRIDGEGFSFCRDEQRALLAATVSPARRRLLERAHRRVDSVDRRRFDRGRPPARTVGRRCRTVGREIRRDSRRTPGRKAGRSRSPAWPLGSAETASPSGAENRLFGRTALDHVRVVLSPVWGGERMTRSVTRHSDRTGAPAEPTSPRMPEQRPAEPSPRRTPRARRRRRAQGEVKTSTALLQFALAGVIVLVLLATVGTLAMQHVAEKEAIARPSSSPTTGPSCWSSPP